MAISQCLKSLRQHKKHVGRRLFNCFKHLRNCLPKMCQRPFEVYAHCPLENKGKKKLVWRENDVLFILKKGRNSLISIALVDYGLYIDQSPQSPSCVSEPRQLNCSDFKYKGVFQRHNCFYKN